MRGTELRMLRNGGRAGSESRPWTPGELSAGDLLVDSMNGADDAMAGSSW
jgi:hypothetical protein